MDRFTVYSGITSVITVVPMVLGAILGRPLMKLFKDPVKMTCFLLTVQAIGGCILFVAQIAGLLQRAPWLFFITMFIIAALVRILFLRILYRWKSLTMGFIKPARIVPH